MCSTRGGISSLVGLTSVSPCRALQVPGHPNPPAPPPSPVPAPSGLPSHVYSVSWPAQRALLTAPGSSWATVSLHPRVLFNLRPALLHSWRVKGLHIRRETMPTGPVVVSMAPVVVPGDVAVRGTQNRGEYGWGAATGARAFHAKKQKQKKSCPFWLSSIKPLRGFRSFRTHLLHPFVNTRASR